MPREFSESDEEIGRAVRSLVHLCPGEDVSIRLLIDDGYEIHAGHGRQQTVMGSLTDAVAEALRKRLQGRRSLP
jgi:hypothetical protein